MNRYFDGDDQAAGLRRLAADVSFTPRPPTRHANTVAVAGGKGGVGKSTISVNLAASFTKLGANTLAFDGDVGMADLNLLLGVAPSHSLADILDGAAPESVLVRAHGITLLPALNGSLRLANMDPVSRSRVLDTIDELAGRFDRTVIDISAGIGENALAFASAATDVVVVATAEPLSLADAYACLKALRGRVGIERALILPNSVRAAGEAEEIVQRLRALSDRFLGIQLEALPAVPFDPMVRVAATHGVPLVLFRPESPASRALVRVARRIMSDTPRSQPVPANPEPTPAQVASPADDK
jgi:flagellar biosynthesis protein FlhG